MCNVKFHCVYTAQCRQNVLSRGNKKDSLFKANAEVFRIKWALLYYCFWSATISSTQRHICCCCCCAPDSKMVRQATARRRLLHGNHEITMNTNRFVSIKKKRFLFDRQNTIWCLCIECVCVLVGVCVYIFIRWQMQSVIIISQKYVCAFHTHTRTHLLVFRNKKIWYVKFWLFWRCVCSAVLYFCVVHVMVCCVAVRSMFLFSIEILIPDRRCSDRLG